MASSLLWLYVFGEGHVRHCKRVNRDIILAEAVTRIPSWVMVAVWLLQAVFGNVGVNMIDGGGT